MPDEAIARLVAQLEAAPGPNNFVQAYWNDDADAQLTRVKRAWDPEDVFHFAQSIPPA